ncbi:MAG: DUF6057 family protein [Phycisphaerae bacterium]|nr:DUF6057 family protein [Phycisphaerae bacterium]
MGGLFRSLIFFIGFYLYLLLDVDLRLIYHGAGEIINFPVFLRGWDFFREFISRPGGMVEYIAAFLSQLFYIGWAGALVATLQAWLICICVGYFLKAINYPRLCWLRYILPILLLITYTQYTYHFITVMALLVALLFICLYLEMIKKSPKLDRFRIVVFLVLSVILYYIAAGAYLLFALLCAIYELLVRGRWKMSLLCLLSAAVIPYVVGVMICGVSIVDAFTDLLPFSWKILYYQANRKMINIVYLIYLLLPLTAIILGLWRIFLKIISKRKSGRMAKAKPRRKSSKKLTGIFSTYFRNNKLKWIIESLALLGIAVGAVFLSYDIEKKTLFLVDYYAYNRKWPQVLGAARRYSDNFSIIHAVNRALYHTHKLTLEMFSYPQHSGTLFLNVKGSEFAYWKKFDFYIDIGLMNIAQNDLTECFEVFGTRPMILKRLAYVNMVKGDIESARIYLGVLGKTLFDADWADKYLKRLQDDPNLTTDDEIRHLRSLMLEKDYGFSALDIEEILSQLLEENRQNRMAFEYMMAWYMLRGQLDKFVQNLERLDDFDYTRIPRIYEEAMLVYVNRTRKALDLRGRQFSRETKDRFRDFSQTYEKEYRRNKQAAIKELAKDYGDSYLFYYVYVYGFSGMKK